MFQRSVHIVTKDTALVARIQPVFEAAGWTVTDSEHFILPAKQPGESTSLLNPLIVRLSDDVNAETRCLDAFLVLLIDCQLEYCYDIIRSIYYHSGVGPYLGYIGLFPEVPVWDGMTNCGPSFDLTLQRDIDPADILPFCERIANDVSSPDYDSRYRL